MTLSLRRLESLDQSLDRLGMSFGLFGGKSTPKAPPPVAPPAPAYTTREFRWALDPDNLTEGPIYFRDKVYKVMDPSNKKTELIVYVRDGMLPPNGFHRNYATGTLWIPKEYKNNLPGIYIDKKRYNLKFCRVGWLYGDQIKELEKKYVNTGIKYGAYMNV